jgi:hypothetical protein
MKRSQMIDVLDKAINSNLYQDYLFDEEMLDSVLVEIEKSGMLPPTIGLPIFGVMDNAWEPEDE